MLDWALYLRLGLAYLGQFSVPGLPLRHERTNSSGHNIHTQQLV